MTAEEIARLVNGELRLNGAAPPTTIVGIAPLDRAELSNVSFLASAKYTPAFADTKAGVVLVSPELADSPGNVPARIVVDKPHDAILTLIPLLYKQQESTGVHETASIGKNVKIGSNVSIGAYAVIADNTIVGDNTHIYSHVTIYPNVQIGNRCIIHSGARIGSDGFGYVFRDGLHNKIPHVGRCIIEDDVEIGANTTIDRGSIDDTVIGAGTKVDNLVHIAHNVRIGKLCLIMAQVGIAGSVHVEDGAILAGQVGLSGHLTVGKGARLAAQAGVFGDIPAGETWSGYPARPHRESLRASSALFKLAGMMKEVEALLKKDKV